MNITKFVPDGLVSNTEGLNLALTRILPEAGTPAAGVAATVVLTLAAQPTANDTFTVDGRRYKFLANGSTPANGYVVIGSSLAATQAAIKAAVNGTDGVNRAHPTVSAGNFTLATLTTSLAGSNNDIVFTSVVQGATGNSTNIVIVVSGNNTALSVGVSGTTITINSATNGSAQATSTAAQVIAAIQASAAASALVTVALAAGNDGTGVVAALSSTALSSGANTCTITARTSGVSGNGKTSVSSFTSGSNSFGAATLTGGVAETPAYSVGKQLFDNSYVYTKISAGSGLTGWRKVAHNAL